MKQLNTSTGCGYKWSAWNRLGPDQVSQFGTGEGTFKISENIMLLPDASFLDAILAERLQSFGMKET